MNLTPPEPLSDRHGLDEFASGVAPLDEWLRRRASKNQATDASCTFVACDASRVVGYYALAAGGVQVAGAPGRFRRNMPEPIPIVVFGRLAIDREYQGQGLGRALFRDAAKRIMHAADSIGIRGVLVQAISDDARTFYLALGFDPSPLEPVTLMIKLADLRGAL